MQQLSCRSAFLNPERLECITYCLPAPEPEGGHFGLTMPVLYVFGKVLPAAVDAPYLDIGIVLGPGNELLFAEQHAGREEVQAIIEAALAE